MPLLTHYKVRARIMLDVVDEMGSHVVSIETSGESRGSSADGLTDSAVGALSTAHDRLTQMTDAYRAGDTNKAIRERMYPEGDPRRDVTRRLRPAPKQAGDLGFFPAGSAEDQADMALRIARKNSLGTPLHCRITADERSRFDSIPVTEIPWDVTP